MEKQDFGFYSATNRLARVSVVRSRKQNKSILGTQNGEFHFIFLISGMMTLQMDQKNTFLLHTGDSITIPGGMDYSMIECPKDSKFLEIQI